MTEIEYIEEIKKAAEDYISVLPKDKRDQWSDVVRATFNKWDKIKEKFCPQTMVSLCDAWLATNRKSCCNCAHFQYEDFLGQGLCAIDSKNKHYSDVCDQWRSANQEKIS